MWLLTPQYIRPVTLWQLSTAIILAEYIANLFVTGFSVLLCTQIQEVKTKCNCLGFLFLKVKL